MTKFLLVTTITRKLFKQFIEIRFSYFIFTEVKYFTIVKIDEEVEHENAHKVLENRASCDNIRLNRISAITFGSLINQSM
jgi:hypothetical protein